MKKIYLLLFTVLIFSCESDNDPLCCALLYDSQITLSVISPEGVDLLNPDNEGAYDVSSARVWYYNEAGEIREIGSSNSLNGIFLIEPEDSGVEKYYIQVTLNITDFDNSITFLEWNTEETDTIKVNFSEEIPSRFGTVWYNDIMIYEEGEDWMPLEIVK